MTTTDANGIVFLEETDAISPFHTLINGLQQGTSDAINGINLTVGDLDLSVEGLDGRIENLEQTSGRYLAYSSRTVSSPPVDGTGVILLNSSIEFEADGVSTYVLEYSGHLSSSSPGARVITQIFRGVNTTTGTVVGNFVFTQGSTADVAQSRYGRTLDTPPAGIVNYFLFVRLGGGVGTVRSIAADIQPTILSAKYA